MADTSTPLDSGVDTSTPIDSGVDTSTPVDSGVDTMMTVDSGADTAETGGTDPGCGGITAAATDVYVDAAATTSGMGGKSCPFKTIQQALAAPIGGSVSRTVWVAAGTYNETGLLQLKAGMTVRGASTATTIVKSKGTCPESYVGPTGTATSTVVCTFYLPAGSTVSDLTINTLFPGDTAPIAVMTASMGPAKVQRLKINAYTIGIFAHGAAEIVNTHIAGNYGSCVEGRGLDMLTIRSESGGTTLLEDCTFGVRASLYTTLNMTGVTVRNSNNAGVYLGWDTSSSLPPRVHTITDSVIIDNGLTTNGHGIQMNAASLKLRGTTILGNGNFGVQFQYIGSATLDIGNSTDHGRNIFSSATASRRNKCVAISLQSSGASGSIPAHGNTWSTCPPAQNTTTGGSPCLYTDILYTGLAVNPVNAGACVEAM